jgi:threonine/homoserine/homoserine lactone efflux protein
MIPLHDLLLYAGIYALVIALPGPNVIAIAARALAGGFRAAIPAALGTALGDIVLMTFSAFGLELVANATGGLFLAVKIAGVLYLFWLGWKYWNAPVESLEVPAPGARGGFFAQAAVTAGNPKGMAFFFALVPSVVDLSHLDLIGYSELVAATLVLIPGITLTYAALADRARRFLVSETARRRLNRSAGAIIIGAALGIAVG